MHGRQDFSRTEPSVRARIGTNPVVLQDHSPGAGNVTVQYDGASKTYSVTFAGGPAGSETFVAATPDASSTSGTSVYKTSSGAVTETLTLVSRSPSSGKAFDYVAAGAWRRDQQNGASDDVFYQPFVFGFPTGAAGAPRNGSAGYDIDVNGYLVFHQATPRTATGSGRFNADFLSGLYSLNASLVERDQETGGVVRTGPLRATGHFNDDASFGGSITYDDFDSAWIGNVRGGLYGPDRNEIAATFQVTAGDGTFVGSMIGTKNASGPTENLALTNLVATQPFAALQVKLGEDPFAASNSVSLRHLSDFTLGPDGSATYRSIDGSVAAFTSADQVPTPGSNFQVYRKAVGGRGAELDVYKPGAANGELALTYAGFGAWRLDNAFDPDRPSREFFTYGILTPYWQLANKSGIARYAGPVHGGAETPQTGVRYDLTGSVRYTVDFSAYAYTGSLALQGVNPTGGGSGRDFGVFDISGGVPLGANNPPGGDFANVHQNGVFVGQISNRFFGPDGEEIAGVFNLTVDGAFSPSRTFLTGVAAAKKN